MKKFIIIFAFMVLLVGCSLQPVAKPNQPLTNQIEIPSALDKITKDRPYGELIESVDYINQIKKVNDYYILQAEKIHDRNIYILAQNYSINKVEPWNAAPTGIEQTGTFYLYQGDINQFQADKVFKIGNFSFGASKVYFNLNRLKADKFWEENFVMIEQYQMNNFSNFYFWLVKADSIAPVKFNGQDSVLAGWTFDSITFNDNYITCYGYWGGQPYDYSETYKDLYWDGSNFDLMMKLTIMNNGQNKYSFYLGENKERPSWELVLGNNFEMKEYFVTPDKQSVVYSKFIKDKSSIKLILHKIKTNKDVVITSGLEVYYDIAKDKCTDNLIYYNEQGIEAPPIDFEYNIATGENKQLPPLYDYSERYK